MRRTLSYLSMVCLLAAWRALPAVQAQDGASWLPTSEWVVLYPLLHDSDCSGGGVGALLEDWTTPFDLRFEDPKPGDEWAIDFERAGVTGWDAPTLGSVPTWVALEWLAEQFPERPPPTDGAGVDFRAFDTALGVSSADAKLGLAATYLENVSGRPLELELCLTSAASAVAFLNNKRLVASSVCRELAAGCQERVAFTLPENVSRLSVLVWSAEDTHAFAASLLLDGQPLEPSNPDVRFLGGSDPGAQGRVEICLERRRTTDSTRGCAAPASSSCSASERIELQAIVPPDFDDGTALVEIEEEIRAWSAPADALVVLSAPGATVEDLLAAASPSPRPCALSATEFVGTDRGRGSDSRVDDRGTPEPEDDVYTTASTSGGAIGGGVADDFLFDYELLSGDFDLAVEILSSSHSSGVTPNGSFGLMARSSLETCARFSMMADHLPDLLPRGRFLRRFDDLLCDAVDASTIPRAALAHPRFLRLTRRGSVVTGWVSNRPGLADGVLSPAIDENWSRIFADDWGEDVPDSLLVGFANNSGSTATQTVRFRLLCSAGPRVQLIGKRIRWETTIDEASGLSYQVCSSEPGAFVASGMLRTQEAAIPLTGVELLRFGAETPGVFTNAEDIGAPQGAGSCSAVGPNSDIRQIAYGVGTAEDGDQLSFCYREVTGDFRLTAEVISRVPPDHGSRLGQYGFMARYGCETDAGFHFAHGVLSSPWSPSPEAAFRVTRRVPDRRGGSLTTSHFLADDTLIDDGQAPRWLRMTRLGNALYHHVSQDGSEWVLVGSSADPAMPSTLLAGVALASGSGHPAEVVYRGVLFEAFDPPASEPLCLGEGDPPFFELSFADAQDLSGSFIVDTTPLDNFAPGVAGGRLRFLRDGLRRNANAVWLRDVDAGVVEQLGFNAEFDLFLSSNETEAGAGVTFAVVEVGARVGGGPFPDSLDPKSLIGESNGALGFARGTIAPRVQLGHPSIALELDLQRDGVDTNDPAHGFHAGVDLNGDVGSLEVSSEALEKTLSAAYSLEGLHVAIGYRPDGLVEVQGTPNDGSGPPRRLASARVMPLSGALLFGFTASSGEQTATAEVDDLRVSAPCCETPDGVEIADPDSTELEVGESLSLGAKREGSDDPGIEQFVWEIVSGTGVLTTLGDGSEAEFEATEEGEVVVAVRFLDFVCTDDARDEVTLVVGEPCPPAPQCTALRLIEETGGLPGIHAFEGETDASPERPVLWTFVATNGAEPPITVGPQESNLALFDLGAGDWTVSATVVDPLCDPDPSSPSCRVVVEICAEPLLYDAPPLVSTLVAGSLLCLRIPAPGETDVGAAVVLELTDPDPLDYNMFFVRWGAPPSATRFDAVAAVEPEASQRLVLPVSREDDLFVLVQGMRFHDGVNRIAFSARRTRLSLAAILPVEADNSATVTATITGSGFDAGTSLHLASTSDGTVVEGAVLRVSSRRAVVEFPLGGAPPGPYDVVAESGGGEDVLLGAFRILEERRSPELESFVTLSPTIRTGYRRVLRVVYRNTGSLQIPSPLFRVESCIFTENVDTENHCRLADADPEAALADVDLFLTGREEPGTGQLTVLGWHPESDVALLPPDDKHTSVITSFVGNDLGFGEVRLLLFDGSRDGPIDWEALPPVAGVPPELWDAARPGLRAALGESWSDYHAALRSIAERLAPRGRTVESALELFRFAFREALGLPTSAILGELRAAGGGEPLPGVLVVALRGEEVISCAKTHGDGSFALECLETEESYALRASGFEVGEVAVSTPAAGDVFDVTLLASAPGPTLETSCTGCDEAEDLPRMPLSPPRELMDEVDLRDVALVNSIDPNSKDGPSDEGDDGGGLVPPNLPLNYSLEFENIPDPEVPPESWAAAKTVLVTDVIDPELDLNTFEFESITLGLEGPIPLELSYSPYECTGCVGPSATALTTVQTSEDVYDVEITATVNYSTREVRVLIDTTGPGFIPDGDGFLPPNTPEVDGEGKGFITFSVSAVQPPASDAEIVNTASILFDNTTLEDTNTVVNTFGELPAVPGDPQPPDQLLPEVSLPVALSWTADGAESHDVYLWTDGDSQPLLPTSEGLPSPSWSPALQTGTTYHWRVAARNDIGEVEGPEWSFRVGSSDGGFFIRGDCDGDGAVGGIVTDAVFLLNYAFLGGALPPCIAACDVNADGQAAQVTDAVVLLNFNFLGGPPPAAPFPACGPGEAAGDVSLGCDDQSFCLGL